MSIAVAVRKGNEIVIAADCLSVFGGLRVSPENHRAEKIRKVGASYLATTGWGLYDNILDHFLASKKKLPALSDKNSIFSFFIKLWKELHDRYHMVNDQAAEEEKSPFGDIDATFMVINPDGIFQISCDLSITEFTQYYAIGSGSDFALGALHVLYDVEGCDAETLARRAVEAAIAFNVNCGGEIVTRKVKARESKE